MLPQVIFINDSSMPSTLRDFAPATPPPTSVCRSPAWGEVQLAHGLFLERRHLVRDYVLRLSCEKVLQHHLAEAGIRVDTPSSQLHHGWEDPHCQLRGHFAGHWLSALSRFAAIDQDRQMIAKLDEALDRLAECQTRNGNGWVGSIPEKYLELLERGHQVWSPQYTLHKTLWGLVDAAFVAERPTAQALLSRWTDWYVAWCRGLVARNRLDVVYQGECAGMLELWAELWDRTKDARYLELCRWYGSPDLFTKLLSEADPLSHTHANATIPWIQGAARAYEVTGDGAFRDVVERFWDNAVTSRGMFATTGMNAGEYFVPPQRFGDYLGVRTQEHCTVYNMVRLAEALHRWTGETTYADYIERALHNGILAQQNPKTGMVCYFLPVAPGSQKVWGTETEDFWCCHGTLLQAHTLVEEVAFHRWVDGFSVDQFVAADLSSSEATIRQRLDVHPDRLGKVFGLQIDVESTRREPWTLRVRKPGWLAGEAECTIDGVRVVPTEKDGYFLFERTWSRHRMTIHLPKAIRREPLPGTPSRFALVDGPVVLAALVDDEVVGQGDLEASVATEHQYAGGQEWKSHHYWGSWGNRTFALVPLYEVGDERYSVYFRQTDPT